MEKLSAIKDWSLSWPSPFSGATGGWYGGSAGARGAAGCGVERGAWEAREEGAIDCLADGASEGRGRACGMLCGEGMTVRLEWRSEYCWHCEVHFEG